MTAVGPLQGMIPYSECNSGWECSAYEPCQRDAAMSWMAQFYIMLVTYLIRVFYCSLSSYARQQP